VIRGVAQSSRLLELCGSSSREAADFLRMARDVAQTPVSGLRFAACKERSPVEVSSLNPRT